MEAILRDASLLFSDSRHISAATHVAQKAAEMQIPVYMDIEKIRDNFLDIMPHVNYLNTSSQFPKMYADYRQALKREVSARKDEMISEAHRYESKGDMLTEGMTQLLIDNPRLQFVITTLGAKGSVLLEKVGQCTSCMDSPPFSATEGLFSIDQFVEDEHKKASEKGNHEDIPEPVEIEFSLIAKLLDSVQQTHFRVTYCPPCQLRQEDIVDTTGAGDVFTAACIYGLAHAEGFLTRQGATAVMTTNDHHHRCGCCDDDVDDHSDKQKEKKKKKLSSIMLVLASMCAAAKCKRPGAREGAPYLHEICAPPLLLLPPPPPLLFHSPSPS